MPRDPGLPHIKNVSAKIGVLERRVEYLEVQIEATDAYRGTAADFMRAERAALKAALDALRVHRAIVEDLDEPLLVLAQLVEDPLNPAFQAAARRVLEDFDGVG